jgi:hypothetical protein
LWTTYVIYLPKLAASVGIAPTAVILILMMDRIGSAGFCPLPDNG